MTQHRLSEPLRLRDAIGQLIAVWEESHAAWCDAETMPGIGECTCDVWLHVAALRAVLAES